ncbi:MAG: AAA family ATPase [Hyphomonadaceae bacterium]|nr:AAA family ATPase [Hyphomonadaceae bacterium]
MHITELRLAGFKSFVDPVRAPIEAGLTGVVGPNGCGKSNLLEAVRWAMGTASAKSMRADDMDDVIFAGSGGRPAREHAEVTLILDGALGKAPAPFHKDDVLEVSRRIRRGLGSTYRINGREVRAKDVQLLFADASTGANSPALVRQGQVSELIAAKPENRRRILEEAAGIAGLHARRHDADLKLRAAETNLRRLEEIMAEIEAQAAGLRRQAKQAERYRTLAHAIREHEALLLHRRWMAVRHAAASAEDAVRAADRDAAQAAVRVSEAQRNADAARDALGPLREEEMIAAAVLRRLEGVRVGLERDVADAEAALARLRDDLARLDADEARERSSDDAARDAITRLERDLGEETAGGASGGADLVARAEDEAEAAEAARAAAEAAFETLSRDAAAQAARAAAIEAAVAAATRALTRANARLAALAEARANSPDRAALAEAAARAAEARATTLAARDAARAALSQAEAALKDAAALHDGAFSRLRDAERAAERIVAEVRALEQVSAAGAKAKFPAVLADIQVETGYEQALAAALGDDLEASLDAKAPASWRGGTTPDVIWPDGVAPLNAHVTAPAQLAARLALIGVIEDGSRYQKQLQPGMRLVSRAGALWRWDGFIRAPDAPSPVAARLEQRNRLKALRGAAKKAEAEAAALRGAWDEAKAARARAEDAARLARAEAPQRGADADRAAAACDAAEAALRIAEERAADYDAQAAAAEADRAEAERALNDAQAQSAPPVDEAALTAARAAMERARADASDARAKALGLRRDREARAARIAAWTQEIAQWRDRAGAAQARLLDLAKARAALAQRAKEAADAPDAARGKLAALMDDAADAEARVKAAGDRLAESETIDREADGALREAERIHAAVREARAAAAARLSAAQERLAHEEAYARETAGREPEDLIGLAGPLAVSPLASGDLHELEKKLDRLKKERDGAGPVNLRAEEELAEAQARLDEMTREKADVEAAVAKLRRGIGQLNAEGRARLLEAFAKVNANFAMLFATLFEGGAAELRLTESDDPLAAGLEIFAQPPGKKLSHLSLMSGGEQALTATALIFAVFLANPAPLCVLDEVDAPLDDANVDRFCTLLDEMRKRSDTRFIVITHNPVTMSRMDRLYGVTMAEPGVSQLVSVDLGRARRLAAM